MTSLCSAIKFLTLPHGAFLILNTVSNIALITISSVVALGIALLGLASPIAAVKECQYSSHGVKFFQLGVFCPCQRTVSVVTLTFCLLYYSTTGLGFAVHFTIADGLWSCAKTPNFFRYRMSALPPLGAGD
jgi:hypothetical protein